MCLMFNVFDSLYSIALMIHKDVMTVAQVIAVVRYNILPIPNQILPLLLASFRLELDVAPIYREFTPELLTI